MNERNDCAFYSEIKDMNATVPCCDIYGFGNCECFGCKKYVSKDDRVVVVRCKDCVHFHISQPIQGKEITECTREGYEYDAASVKPDDFCSYGERKETDE